MLTGLFWETQGKKYAIQPPQSGYQPPKCTTQEYIYYMVAAESLK